MWIASIPLWVIAIACILSAVDIGWRSAEIDEKRGPGCAGFSFIIALACSSLFACAGVLVWRL